jgi:hypothetical protein
MTVKETAGIWGDRKADVHHLVVTRSMTQPSSRLEGGR